MTVRFTWNELVEATGGHWLREYASEDGICGVQDDSRQIAGGELFVAVRGELADGYRYAAKALRAGAAAICLDREPDEDILAALDETKAACLLVPDALIAFQELARAHRRRLPHLLVVAITGSCGKTSTKEMIAAVLNGKWPGLVHKTAGNFNNHFGVPRTLLELTGEHRAAVIELGSNHPGEIASLVRLAQPEIGVVSNIGSAHLEFFHDLAGVAEEKSDIFAGIAATGVCILPAEAAHIGTLRSKAAPRQTLSFGTTDAADIQARYQGLVGEDYVVELARPQTSEQAILRWPIGGAHQALNAAAAASVGLAAGLRFADSVAALATCQLPGMRMKVVEIDGVRWVNDAYNANPTSMRAGLDWFHDLLDPTLDAAHILVLGDMLELGPDAATAHVDLLRWAKERFPQARILTVGPLMTDAAGTCDLPSAANAEDAAKLVRAWATPGALVFLKGSRGIALEHCLPRASDPH
ncbi:MAG: UDP-N-acetylmuramoyl-tripeptide--D-alanyl-D-alanine ligase [Victivallales bacterium]|nr:UDP-N-acetylmuramoyl-tripeptide--D-alanyl-D-alanine ligase [Victivallales bacterium]MBT7301050.1 UDP-N-acetylmuramoyl-tripeptide--D-alanyl-D-alanine ligase [Victivallales bacterium]